MQNLDEIMDKLYTVKDVAEYWTVSKGFVHSLVREKRIAHVRIGKSVRFKAQHLRDYEEANSSSIEVSPSNPSGKLIKPRS